MRVLIAVSVLVAGCALTACTSNTDGTGLANAVPTSVSATTPPTTPSTPAAGSTSPTRSASATPSPTTKPIPATPLREATVTATNGTVYDIKIWADVSNDSCADHAHGLPVVQYLTAHPCRGLERLLATTTVSGRPVGFDQATLSFVGTAPQVYQTAGTFAELEKKDGTGSVDDLFSNGYREPGGPSSLPSPDAFAVFSQDSVVTIVDAFYLDGATPNNDAALEQMAQDIYLQY